MFPADVTEFLADFSKTYGAMFGVTTLEKIEKDLEEKKKDPRKLSYRKVSGHGLLLQVSISALLFISAIHILYYTIVQRSNCRKVGLFC